VSPLTGEDLAHIIEGDNRGDGGHGPGRGVEQKTEFPAAWDEAKIKRAVESAVWDSDVPRQLSRSPRGVVIRALYDGVIIETPVRRIGRSWEVSSAYPISGDGIYRNVGGQRHPVPLNIDDLARRLDL
jgi:hypothetical protein